LKKLLALLALALIVFAAIYRQRIFLWDPLATVTRDGAKQSKVRVMINFSNDVLMDDRTQERRRLYLLQDGKAEFSIGFLRCVQYLACFTDADQATNSPLEAGNRRGREPFEGVTMNSKLVEFVDENGDLVKVSLR
jgi:hypothetical protein